MNSFDIKIKEIEDFQNKKLEKAENEFSIIKLEKDREIFLLKKDRDEIKSSFEAQSNLLKINSNHNEQLQVEVSSLKEQLANSTAIQNQKSSRRTKLLKWFLIGVTTIVVALIGRV